MRKPSIVVLLVLSMSIFVAGCFGASPETVTQDFLTAFKASDFEKAASYAVTQNASKIETDMAKDEDGERIGKLILSNTSYEVGKAVKEGDKAKVSVKVTAVDMVRIATKAMSELMPLAFAAAFSETDNNEMDAMMNQYLENSILDPQAPKVTTDVNVNLVKTNNGWKIAEDNDDLFNAITGNAAKAFNKK